MPPRPLDLLDLSALYQHRGDFISLDTTRLLTRGNPISALGLMSYLNPIRHIYSAAMPAEEGKILHFGGVIHDRDASYARLVYLAPSQNVPPYSRVALIEHLNAHAGGWGAFHTLAEVDETSEAFISLRESGFSVYAWQRVWNISAISANTPDGPGWNIARSEHLPALQSLHHQIVPPLLQSIEPMPHRATGKICFQTGRCHVQVISGIAGIVLKPFIHPEVSDVPARIATLTANLPNRHGRPTYLLVRSYQAWLESALEELGATAGPRQAVMVKHLTRLIKDGQPVTAPQPSRAIPASRIDWLKRHKEL